jgi:acyl-[acyl-carrier-protein]-phospholipid O-acyltransferase / long-chain-fatty-acid--[acyl-carrier-protein] ligase
MVGILLPPSTTCALVNFAAMLLGKVPVNLNYTLSSDALAACAKLCDLQIVLTSRAFLERFPVCVPATTLCIEDACTRPRLIEKFASIVSAIVMPAQVKTSIDDLATIVFSSGSTGEPKGVMLTHYNIAANVEQLGQAFDFNGRDRLLGVLPFFHSFGFTATFALPLSLGVGVVYHANPLDAQTIGSLVRKHAVSFLLATPTFLQMYVQRCSPADFGSLNRVLVGAEKLPDRLTQAFHDRFGIYPLEAYGLTECAPAVTVNTRDFRAAGYLQIGSKRGRIGHPLPAVSVSIVDPETFRAVPLGEPGLLLVRGPNVMKGYLGRDDLTAAAMHDGWYITGDIATLDEDGFLAITGRLNRFSKIGGEMVPHMRIEEVINNILGSAASVVTAVPDSHRGEKLIALYCQNGITKEELWQRLNDSDLPKLWIPKRDDLFVIESLPVLGSGKIDLKAAKSLAQEHASKN